jgi:hypothetical protein
MNSDLTISTPPTPIEEKHLKEQSPTREKKNIEAGGIANREVDETMEKESEGLTKSIEKSREI